MNRREMITQTLVASVAVLSGLPSQLHVSAELKDGEVLCHVSKGSKQATLNVGNYHIGFNQTGVNCGKVIVEFWMDKDAAQRIVAAVR